MIQGGRKDDMEPPCFDLRGLGDGASPLAPATRTHVAPRVATESLWLLPQTGPRARAQKCELQRLVPCPPGAYLIPRNGSFAHPALPPHSPLYLHTDPILLVRKGRVKVSAPLYSTRGNQGPESAVMGPGSHREQSHVGDRTQHASPSLGLSLGSLGAGPHPPFTD